MSSLTQTIHSQPYVHCNNCEIIVTAVDDCNSINQFKSKKCDGYGLDYIDHFNHVPHKLQGLPSILFTAMVYHGYTPDGFDITTIQPLLKINKRTSSKYYNKYRTFAFCNI